MVLTQKLDFKEIEQNRSYRIFLRAVQNRNTLKTYKYHLKNFLKYVNLPNYDSIIACGTDKIQELLENWVLDLTDKGRKGTAIKTTLAGVELFLEMNKVIYHKKLLHRLVQRDTQELDLRVIRKMAESFAKGEPHAKRIGLTIFRNQVYEALRKIHSDTQNEN